MSLDILNPSILNEEKSIGGFCVIELEYIDNVNYFEVDANKIGVNIGALDWKMLAPRLDVDIINTQGVLVALSGDRLWNYGSVEGGNYPFTAHYYIYDVSTGQWTKTADTDQTGERELNGPVAEYNPNDGYVYLANGAEPTATNLQKRIYEINLDTATWTYKGNSKRATRYSESISDGNDQMYIAGGHKADTLTTDNFEVYTMGDGVGSNVDITTALSPLPERRSRGALAYHDDGVDQWIYYAGGGGDDAGSYADATIFWRYNIGTNTWEYNDFPDQKTGTIIPGNSNIAPMPEARRSPKAQYYDGGIWVFGGSTTYSPTVQYFRIMRYDIATNTWELKGWMPTQLSDGGTALIGDDLYWVSSYDRFLRQQTKQFWRHTFGENLVCAVKLAVR